MARKPGRRLLRVGVDFATGAAPAPPPEPPFPAAPVFHMGRLVNPEPPPSRDEIGRIVYDGTVPATRPSDATRRGGRTGS